MALPLVAILAVILSSLTAWLARPGSGAGWGGRRAPGTRSGQPGAFRGQAGCRIVTPCEMPAALRLAAFYLAYFAYVGAFTPYFPLYLSGRGLTPAELATVLAMPQLARIFAPTFWGWLADRHDARRAVVVTSCAALAAGFAAIPYVPGFAGIAALIAAASVLSAGGLPLVEAGISVARRSLRSSTNR